VSGVICYVVTASQTVSDLLRDKPKGKHLNLVSQFPRYWLAGSAGRDHQHRKSLLVVYTH
jgi:hypothetical protein